MDTHIANFSDSEEPPLMTRLPGETAPDVASTSPAAPEPDERPQNAALPRRKRRHLLFGASMAALAVVASGVFLVSPNNHVVPVPGLTARVRHIAAQAGIQVPSALLAPAAQLAKVQLPPPPPPTIQPHFQPAPPDRQMQELLALQSGRPTDAKDAQEHPGKETAAPHPAEAAGRPGKDGAAQAIAAAKPGQAPPGYTPHEPGSSAASAAKPALPPLVASETPPPAAVPSGKADQAVSVTPPSDLTATVVASFTPHAKTQSPESGTATAANTAPHPESPVSPPAATALSKTAASQAPADPSEQARTLRAAPLSTPEQIQVIGLVTQLATELKAVKAQDEALRQDVRRHDADTAKRLEDFERRLGLSEARTALAAAAAPPAPANPPAVAPTAPVRLTSVAAARSSTAPDPKDGARKHYRVQAASPGLALLAQVDRGGGDGAQLQVVVGDTVPGYGRVSAISQRGTSWVVTTEHGSIH